MSADRLSAGKRIARLAAGVLLALTAGVALYFSTAWLLVLVPVNDRPAQHDAASGATVQAPAVQAHIYDNGVHTDFVLPIHAQGVDWRQRFAPQHVQQMPEDAAYVTIGWGDREFYLHTPHWRDLTARRALQALSGSGRSLMHVSYLREDDIRRNPGFHALPLSATQYEALVRFIDASLVRSADGQGNPVPGQHYASNDAFYEAHGAYSLFTTCNVWTGRGLKQAGVPVSAWTPLASQVTWHLDKPEAQAKRP